jgi:hypothetical protein
VPAASRPSVADSFRPVLSSEEQALFFELYSVHTPGRSTAWDRMADAFNVRVAEARSRGEGLSLFFKRPAQLQSYAKKLIQLVSEGNSLALFHTAGLQPVVSPSLQAAAAQFVASLATAPVLSSPEQVQMTAGVAGVSSLPQPALDTPLLAPPSVPASAPRIYGKSRATAPRTELGTGNGRGGAGSGKACVACTELARENCMMRGSPHHKEYCPFRAGSSGESHHAFRKLVVEVGEAAAMSQLYEQAARKARKRKSTS